MEIEGEEYIPPGGLFVPGLYSPPNELAKANGLTLFYPKVINYLMVNLTTAIRLCWAECEWMNECGNLQMVGNREERFYKTSNSENLIIDVGLHISEQH